MPNVALALLAAFEAADVEPDLDAWCRSLQDGLRRATDARACQLLRVLDGGERLEVLGAPDALAAELLATGHAGLDARQRHRIYRSGATAVQLADVHGDAGPPAPLARAMRAVGVADIVGLVAPPGVSLGLFLPRARPLDARTRPTWISVARLVGAGVALRSAPGEERHLDSDLPARLQGALDVLDRRRIEARRRGDARDAESAFAFLSALADDGYSVVEERRVGGRRRLVAVRPRDPAARSLRALDAGERQVLDRLRRGASLQEIAFDLGLAEATVSGRIARIRRKIGVDPRSALVHVAGLHEPR